LTVAERLHGSVQLHLDSFVITPSELQSRIDHLLYRYGVSEMLRATILDKPIGELTDKYRPTLQAPLAVAILLKPAIAASLEAL
jgi:hypothetical protein